MSARRGVSPVLARLSVLCVLPLFALAVTMGSASASSVGRLADGGVVVAATTRTTVLGMSLTTALWVLVGFTAVVAGMLASRRVANRPAAADGAGIQDADLGQSAVSL